MIHTYIVYVHTYIHTYIHTHTYTHTHTHTHSTYMYIHAYLHTYIQVIQQQLIQPPGFVSAIKELMDWCGDIRAFQPQYENGLMGCLHMVNRFCSSPGFDLQLGKPDYL